MCLLRVLCSEGQKTQNILGGSSDSENIACKINGPLDPRSALLGIRPRPAWCPPTGCLAQKKQNCGHIHICLFPEFFLGCGLLTLNGKASLASFLQGVGYRCVASRSEFPQAESRVAVTEPGPGFGEVLQSRRESDPRRCHE